MSLTNVHKMPAQPSITVSKALAELTVAQDRKNELAFDFEQAIRALVAAENKLYLAKLHSQAKYRD